MKTEIVPVIFAILLVSSAQAQDAISTRYGNLITDADNNLTFKGKVINPEIYYKEGWVSYGSVGQFKIGQSDVILFRQSQGNSCPGSFSFVTVTARGKGYEELWHMLRRWRGHKTSAVWTNNILFLAQP